MNKRNEYPLSIKINNRRLSRVTIDQHYRLNHPDVSDDLILKLIQEIDGEIFDIEIEKNGFEYFAVEPVAYSDKPYRLVLLLCVHDDFLGVINAFRVPRKKYE